MPEPENSTPNGLCLPADDPAAPAVEALRAMASYGPVEASPELAAFLDDPAVQGSGTTPSSRRALVTVVRLPIRRAGRVAVAVGAALALAAIGGVAVAATGGTPDREPAQVQQDDPSDTTTSSTTSTESETESPETETSTETETATAEPQETEADQSSTTQSATHTANPVASANHHDGKGSDDEHADVNGGGSVDHHQEHATATHPTGGDDQGEDQGGDTQDQGGDQGDGGSSQPDGGSHGG